MMEPISPVLHSSTMHLYVVTETSEEEKKRKRDERHNERHLKTEACLRSLALLLFKGFGLPSFSSSPLQTVSLSSPLIFRYRTSFQVGPPISSTRISAGAPQSACRSCCLDGTPPGQRSCQHGQFRQRCVGHPCGVSRKSVHLWSVSFQRVHVEFCQQASLFVKVPPEGYHVVARGPAHSLPPELPPFLPKMCKPRQRSFNRGLGGFHPLYQRERS